MVKTGKYQKSTFAKNVIALRKARGMSGLAFAEFAEIPFSTLADIESGISGGRESTKKKIAAALETTVDALNTPHLLESKDSKTERDLRIELMMRVFNVIADLTEPALLDVLDYAQSKHTQKAR